MDWVIRERLSFRVVGRGANSSLYEAMNRIYITQKIWNDPKYERYCRSDEVILTQKRHMTTKKGAIILDVPMLVTPTSCQTRTIAMFDTFLQSESH